MSTDLGDLTGGVPPRQVDALTTVSGHNMSRFHAQRAFCECGARQPADESTTATEWRESHLQQAWPEVRRLVGETAGDFLARLSDLFVAASMREQGIENAHGLNQPITPGGKFPLVTDESIAAGELVEVIRHQMDKIRDRLLETSWKI